MNLLIFQKIHLLTTSQTNLLLNLGAPSSLHKHSHHQIIFTKFDLEVYYLYHTSNTFGIIHWIVMAYTKLFLIITNLISNGTMVCDDREPLHMNKRIKNFISRNGIFLKKNSTQKRIQFKNSRGATKRNKILKTKVLSQIVAKTILTLY